MSETEARQVRPRSPRKRRQDDRKATSEDSPVYAAFQTYQKELDAKHDRTERLVKASRDLTTCSKRIIFLLHRVVGAANRLKILQEAEQKFGDAKNLLEKIARELHADGNGGGGNGDATHRYRRSYKWGVQEYIEALSFYHYCQHGSLIGYEEMLKMVEFPEAAPPSPPTAEDAVGNDAAKRSRDVLRLAVSPLDYILGIADLTGECMRMCINSVGSGEKDGLAGMCDFVRGIYDAFRTLNCTSGEIGQKVEVMEASLRKMETTCYNVTVRGSERFPQVEEDEE